MNSNDARESNDHGELPAGDFSSWIAEVERALRGEGDTDVPCGSCTACCRSSQFVHIEPDEADTLAHIPAELLFRAPRSPHGHVLMGYDARGHCPMLIDDRCSIYEHRPRTCRTYDCRVFPAAGVELDDDEKAAINERAQRWRFSHATPAARAQHDAVRAAATFLREHEEVLPAGMLVSNTTQLAVLAVRMHDLFLGADGNNNPPTEPEPEVVRVEIDRRRRR